MGISGMRFVAVACLSLALSCFCLGAVGCSEGAERDAAQAPATAPATESPTSPESQEPADTTPDAQTPGATEQAPTPEETPRQTQAPVTTTAYLQEIDMGEGNVLTFTVKEQDGQILTMIVSYGYVEVSGNRTTKRNYTTSTTVIDTADASAFRASFGQGSSTIVGAVTGEGIAGTISIADLGEFAFDAPRAAMGTCSSCNGTGRDYGIGATGGSSTCTTCFGTGSAIEYKGSYI